MSSILKVRKRNQRHVTNIGVTISSGPVLSEVYLISGLAAILPT